MPTPKIPFPVSTAPGGQPLEGAGRLINCAAEPTIDGRSVRHRQPGLTTFCTTTQNGYRGGLLVTNFMLIAFNGRLQKVDAAGAVSDVGALAGTKPVFMARNNLVPTCQVAIVTENGAFLTDATGAAPIAWPDADLPFPNSVCFQDGYFFFGIGDRRVFASGINSSSVDPLCFTTAESKSQDALIRVVAHKGLLFIFTTAGCEVWSDTANPAPGFPYSRLAVLDRGLIAPTAVAGWEEGFGNMLWVADNCGVYRLGAGLQPDKVSSPDLDRLIQAQAKVDPTQLQAGCYTVAGKSFWTISGPGFTWEFNLESQKWNERMSLVLGQFTRWRGMFGTLAFNKWLLGDTQTGSIGAIDGASYREFGTQQVCRIESGAVADFPVRTRVARVDFEFQPGVGIATGIDPIEVNPTVEISWSDDGGTKWSVPIMRKLGRQADGRHACYATSLGTSSRYGRRWRLDIADPVYVGHIGGTQSTTVRAP
jgi:hypothetical protein